jgi:phosphatidylserine/phosphatidylglycerophosphate/cardiolipin synthase-like enzyme
LIRLVLNDDHLGSALEEAFSQCRHRLFIATADVKDLYLPVGGARGRRGKERPRTILDVFAELAARGVEVRLLHSGVPSGPFLEDLKNRKGTALLMRRCVRVHAKVVIADGRWMYLGSANLTGAGLGAKSAVRRNFEAGLVTDDVSLIDPVADMLADVFGGGQCTGCGRKAYCPVPLEEPHL